MAIVTALIQHLPGPILPTAVAVAAVAVALVLLQAVVAQVVVVLPDLLVTNTESFTKNSNNREPYSSEYGFY